jgi:hypothetical protein
MDFTSLSSSTLPLENTFSLMVRVRDLSRAGRGVILSIAMVLTMWLFVQYWGRGDNELFGRHGMALGAYRGLGLLTLYPNGVQEKSFDERNTVKKN